MEDKMSAPSTTQSKSQPAPTAKKKGNYGTIFFVAIVVLVACVMSTLFTMWTPGQPRVESLAQWPSIDRRTTPQAAATEGALKSVLQRGDVVIGIVAGHWGNDSGATCPDGLKEVDINQNIAALTQKNLIDAGYQVDLLQEFDARLEGYKSNALVSIHADSCDYVNDQATGYKVAAAAGIRFPDRAARLTACLRQRYGQYTNLPIHSTSVTRDMTFYHAFEEIDPDTPAAIIEVGFMNLDRQFLVQTPELAAQGIAAAIVCYIENQPISMPTLPVLPTKLATAVLTPTAILTDTMQLSPTAPNP